MSSTGSQSGVSRHRRGPPSQKRKLIDLVQEDDARVQDHDNALQQDSKRHGKDKLTDGNDLDQDFMSDSLLPAEPPVTDRNRGKASRTAVSGQRRRLDEKEARRTGLSRSFMPGGKQYEDGASRGIQDREDGGHADVVEPEEGSTKALQMMIKMGYQPGQALGGTQSTTPEQASSNAHQTSKESTGLKEPLPLNLERVSSSKEARRAGIGASISRSIAHAAAAAADADADTEPLSSSRLEDFRSQASSKAALVHTEKCLIQAKRVCRDLDAHELGMHYSPLWLEAAWFSKRDGEREAEEERLVQMALSDSRADEEEKEIESSEDEEREALSSFGKDAGKGGPLTRPSEARQFLSLAPPTQLELVLSHLRTAHHYCLYCGTAYKDAAELSRDCPGLDEDDH
ncbi:unnamed protein product [Jaminaea pallidilutea]